MRRILPAGLAIFAMVALVGLLAQPAVGEAEARPGATAAVQEQIDDGVRQRLQEQIEELRVTMEELREQLEEMRVEGRFRIIEPGTFDFERERIEEMSARAREMAERAARRTRDLHLEPLRLHMGSWIGGGVYAERILDHADDLELTESQIERIRDLERAYRRQEVELDADIEVAEMDLEALEEDESAELAEIRAALERVSSLRIDRQMAALQHRRDVREVLSPEQRAELDEMGIVGGARWAEIGPRVRVFRR